jgi:hypothetical protein
MIAHIARPPGLTDAEVYIVRVLCGDHAIVFGENTIVPPDFDFYQFESLDVARLDPNVCQRCLAVVGLAEAVSIVDCAIGSERSL